MLFQQLALIYTSSAAVRPPRFHFPFIFPLSAPRYLQLCHAIPQGCHKNIIIKCLVVSWALSSKATRLNMRSFFPDPKVCPTPPTPDPNLAYLFFVVLGGCSWEYDDMSMCSSYPSPHYSSLHLLPVDVPTTVSMSKHDNFFFFTLACCSTVNHCSQFHIYVYVLLYDLASFFQYEFCLCGWCHCTEWRLKLFFLPFVPSLPYFPSALGGGVTLWSEHCLDIYEPPITSWLHWALLISLG